jgi:nitrogen fixation protein FixH
MKNVLIFLVVCFTNLVFAQNADEMAIKTVIEKETQSFNDRDAATMIACHANQPYALMLVTENGNVHYSTNEKNNQPEGLQGLISSLGAPNGDSFKNMNYNIRVNGTAAFAYFDQVATSKAGKTQHFHEVRYLEKFGNDWKIIYVGAVQDEPKK